MLFPLKYVGAILPSMSSSRFVNSVFCNVFSNRYFIQQQDGEQIGSFKKIKLPKGFVKIKSDIRVKIKDPYIYSFTVGNKTIFHGNRSVIEKDLIQLLNSEELNVHSKLLVSSFLNLDGRTVQLVEDSNHDFEEKGIAEKIELNKFFEKSSKLNKYESNPIDLIRRRYETFKNLNNNISFRDIACINEDKAYFNNMFTEAKEIIKKSLLDNSFLNEMISDIITFCSSKQMIDLSKIFKSNEAYEFMLESEYVTLDQKDIERFLSAPVRQNKIGDNKSILNIGIDFDKEIYEAEKANEIKTLPDPRSEKALMDSFWQITEAQLI